MEIVALLENQSETFNLASLHPAFQIFLTTHCHYFIAAGPRDTPTDDVLEKTYDPKTGKGMPEL